MFVYFTFPSRKFPLSKVLWGRRNGAVDVVPLLLQKAFEAALFVFVPGGLVSERRPTACGCSPGWVGAIPGACRHLLCTVQGRAEKTKPKHSAHPHASSFLLICFPSPLPPLLETPLLLELLTTVQGAESGLENPSLHLELIPSPKRGYQTLLLCWFPKKQSLCHGDAYVRTYVHPSQPFSGF